MARVHMSKTKQTGVDTAGIGNFTPEILEGYRDEEAGALLAMIAPIFVKKVGSPTQNRRTNWKPEELREELSKYFIYFATHGLKPSKSSIRLWLNTSQQRYDDWANNPATYGEISEIIQMANDVLETQYINRGEKHPQMNMFLLKASHGLSDTQKVEVTTNRTEKSDIDRLIEQMKLSEEIMEIEGEIEKDIE